MLARIAPAGGVTVGPTTPDKGAAMAELEVKSFDSPDEVRPFEGKGQAQVVNVAGRVIGRGTFAPGWRWSENVKPIAGTDSCQVSHLGYCVSGRMQAPRRRRRSDVRCAEPRRRGDDVGAALDPPPGYATQVPWHPRGPHHSLSGGQQTQ